IFAARQRKNIFLLCRVIERAELPNFFNAAGSIQRIEVAGITRRKLNGLQIARAQISILESVRTLTSEEMKTQPAAIGARDALRFSKKGDEQEEDEIGVDVRLELEVASKMFGRDLARAVLELDGGVERMIDFLHEGDERANVVIAKAGTRIRALELFDQPAGVIDSDVKAIVRGAQKSPRELAQFARGSTRQDRQLRTSEVIDQTIF